MSDKQDEFFVGYLPTPLGQRRFLLLSCIAVMLSLCLVAVVIAAGQRDPGTGQWFDQELAAVIGVLHESPYPSIQAGTQTVLLVSKGKVGAAERVRGLEGKTVKVQGQRIERGDIHLLELDDAAGAIAMVPAIVPTSGETVAKLPDEVTLQGEIVNPKCYCGAMKPGEGMTHKACATLCIRGGIPPVLVTQDGPYVLADGTGAGLVEASLDAVLPFVGDPVEVRGRIEQRGDLRVLKINPGSVHRK